MTKENLDSGINRDKIITAVNAVLSPWLKTPSLNMLPAIKTIEIARRTGLSSAKVLGQLSTNPLDLCVDGQNYQTALIPKSIKPTDGLETFYSLVSAKKVIGCSREFNFRDGSKVVDRSRFSAAKLRRVAFLQARDKTRVSFVPKTNALAIEQQKPPVKKKQREKDWEYIMSVDNLPTEKAPLILDTLRYFEVNEFNRRPIPDRPTLLNKLVNLARGFPELFLVYNCFRFQWEERGKKYPAAKIDPRIELTPVFYHGKTIKETAKVLSQLGPAIIALVVPDSEAKDSRLWEFAQTEEERKLLIKKVRQNLDLFWEDITRYNGIDSLVMTWSELCLSFGLPEPQVYTTTAYDKIKQNAELISEIESVCIPEDDSYLISYGINPGVIKRREKLERVLWYYSMYYGEGMALSDMDACVINIEDFRVTDWLQKGANDKLVVVSPTSDIYTYYAWRKEQLRKLQTQ
ncbi:MAG: hypothetical protein M1120_01080 [Patescibacteria group bacterium]|nr:hypothetical protein [Patescibacteria group bacterium]